MKKGRYALDLFCDKKNPTHEGRSFPDRYIGHDRQGAMIQARADGWLVYYPPGSAKEVHICPTCSGVEG